MKINQMVSSFQAIILSIVQGITEWFPVSSSGHLALIQNYFGFQNLSFDVFLHLASILAVLILFYKDVLKLFSLKENHRYILLIVVGIIPAGIVGYFFKDSIEKLFSNMFYLGLFFIFSGIIVFSTKFTKEKKDNITFSDSLFIGIFQAIAILPGISRSGATISSGLYRGLKKAEVVKYSFLMAMPIIFGAGIFEAKNIIYSDISYPILISSFILTLLVSLVTIRFLIKIINSERFYLFGVYNFIVGVIVLIIR